MFFVLVIYIHLLAIIILIPKFEKCNKSPGSSYPFSAMHDYGVSVGVTAMMQCRIDHVSDNFMVGLSGTLSLGFEMDNVSDKVSLLTQSEDSVNKRKYFLLSSTPPVSV